MKTITLCILLSAVCAAVAGAAADAENWHQAYMSEEVTLLISGISHNYNSSSFVEGEVYVVGHLVFGYGNQSFYFKPVDPEVDWVAGAGVYVIQTWSGTDHDTILIMGGAISVFVDVVGTTHNSYGYVDSLNVMGTIVVMSPHGQTRLEFSDVTLHPCEHPSGVL